MSHRQIPLSRRAILRGAAKAAGLGVVAAMGGGALVTRSAFASIGRPQPEELYADAIKRLFGDRTIQDGESLIELKVPMIAENGAVVQTRIEVKAPAGKHVQRIVILVDKNRRPMAASYTFTPDAGAALVGTNLRMGGTSPVRAIAELNDGTLYQVAKEVRVTVGGCGG